MLYEAVCKHDAKRVLKMVRAGGNVNQVLRHGWTPVVRAVVSRNRKICEILLQHGADPNLGMQAETGALNFARGRDPESIATIKLLIKYGVLPDRLIHAAAAAGTVGTVRQILKRGANPNLLDYLGHPPLRCARSPAIIRELFRFGANPLAYSADNEHALHFHAGDGRARHVQALLDGGVPPNYPEPSPPDQPEIGDGFALHMAVSLKRYGCAKVLLEAGADTELLSDYHTVTPLMTACNRGMVRIVKLLLEHGAKATVRACRSTPRREAILGLQQNPAMKKRYLKILSMLRFKEPPIL